jgi:catechol 2,3-dioxygenase-like lactoylglutathione lyase family enzyme
MRPFELRPLTLNLFVPTIGNGEVPLSASALPESLDDLPRRSQWFRRVAPGRPGRGQANLSAGAIHFCASNDLEGKGRCCRRPSRRGKPVRRRRRATEEKCATAPEYHSLLKLGSDGPDASHVNRTFAGGCRSEEPDAASASAVRKTSMTQQIGLVTLIVRDYDEALSFFVDKLGFGLVADTPLGGMKRWVVVSPSGSAGPGVLLARAADAEEEKAIGAQSAGRVFLFLHTDDFYRDYTLYRERGVKFCEEPRKEPYGTVAVFEDLHGNFWDLIQLRSTDE